MILIENFNIVALDIFPNEFCIETTKSFRLFVRPVWQVLNVFIGLFPVFANQPAVSAVIPFAHSCSPDCQGKSVTIRIEVVHVLCPPPSLRTRSLQRIGDNITTWNWSGITSVSLAYITSMTSIKTSQQGMIVLLKLRLGSDYNSMSSLLCPVLGGVWTGDWIRNIRLAEIGSNENTHLASVLRHLM